jgi:hypothetical protein
MVTGSPVCPCRHHLETELDSYLGRSTRAISPNQVAGGARPSLSRTLPLRDLARFFRDVLARQAEFLEKCVSIT